MQMKKSAIALALGAALAAGAANAGTFVTGNVEIANELFGAGSEATKIGDFTAVYTMAAAPGDGAAFLVTYTLNNGATWGDALTSADLVYGGAGAVTIALVEGGTADDSTATFRVDVTSAMAADETLTLTYNVADAGALATAGADLNLAIELSDGLGSVDTAANADYATSANATVEAVAVDDNTSDFQIDVANSSTKFTGDDKVSETEVKLGTISITEAGSAKEDDAATGWVLGVTDATATGTLVVTGDFSASLGVDGDGDADTADGVWLDIDGSGAYNAGEEATTLTATSASWDLTQANLVSIRDNGPVDVRMVVDGSTAIGVAAPSATLTIDWADATYADDVVTGDLNPVEKNGSSTPLSFLLTPNGTFANYVRISNTSGLAGNVFLTVYNDAGDTVNIDLGDVAGQATELAAQASTSLININDIYAAAQAADASFDHNGGKLRMVVEGEIPSISAQAFNISTDGTTFSMMQ